MTAGPERAATTGAGSPPIAMAMGGGGAFGIAFHLGVAHALLDAGIPVDRGPMVGISAGAYAGAALATGTDLEQIQDGWRHFARTRGKGRARTAEITTRLFGDRRDGRVTAVCTTGISPLPVLVKGSQHPLSDVVAAAASPLGMAHGHWVDGRKLYDAGMYWNTGAMQAPRADLLLVLAPLAVGVRGKLGYMWEAQLQREVTWWRLRHGGRAMVVRPDAAVVAAGARKRGDILDIEKSTSTYQAAYAQGERLAPRLRALNGRTGATRTR
jgi:hypothetical protein